MFHQKGDGADHHDLCQPSPGCDHNKGWTWPSSSCGNRGDVPEDCHQPCSLSHDTEGSSCQSPPLSQPSSCPTQQSSKPRRRVEISPVPPACPPPVKIHRRPLEQHRPRPACPERESCGKPRRRVEQRPEDNEEPPVVLEPPARQRRCPRHVPCCPRPVSSCPRPVPCCPQPVPSCPQPTQRRCPPVVPLSHHQQHKQVTLQVPLCVKN